MWVSVNKTLFENHLHEHLRNQLRKFFQVYTHFVEFGDSSDRNASFEAHSQNSWPSLFVIDFGDCDSLVCLEYLCTALGILCFNLEVEFFWETGLKLVGQPSVAKVREDFLSQVAAKLNHLQVTRHLLLDPLMLHLDCNHLASTCKASFVHLAKGCGGEWFGVKGGEDLLERTAELLLYDCFHVAEGSRWSLHTHWFEGGDVFRGD